MSRAPSSPEDLLERAKAGQLSEDEVRRIAEALRRGKSSADPYTLLNAFGWADEAQHPEVVERFLDERADPMLASLALQILCGRWGLYERYARLLSTLIDGVSWDAENDVRDVVLSLAGEAVRSGVSNSPELLAKLVSVASDGSEDALTRQPAYFGVLRALGRDWNELPSAAVEHAPDDLIEASVLAEARGRLAAPRS